MKFPFDNLFQRVRRNLTMWNYARSQNRVQRAVAVLSSHARHEMPRASWFVQRRVRGAISVLRENHSHFIRNWYEGGFPLLSGDAAWRNQVVQDARFDQNFVNRRELMRRMRNHAQDVPIHKAGQALRRQYVIGTHMPVVTSLASDDGLDNYRPGKKSWRALAEEVWHEMIDDAGLNGESLFSMLNVGLDCKGNDGDVGYLKTSKPKIISLPNGRSVKVDRPCYQMVEAHRVETPFDKFAEEGRSVIDGVAFMPVTVPVVGNPGATRSTLKRIGYWVRDAVDLTAFKDSYTFVPNEGIEFIYSPNRVAQVRGISDYYAVETTLSKLRDMLTLEFRAQEVQSQFALFITNGAGQVVTPKMQETFGALNIQVSKDASGAPIATVADIEKVRAVYKEIFGGETAVGRTGDTMMPMAPTRPSEATMNLWQYLIDCYCVGARLPRCLVFPKTSAGGKSQGTEVRAELDSANSGFIGEFNANWKPFIKRTWVYFIGWAIKNDPRLVDAPADWQHIEVSPPRSVLVDAGYDSAATIAEMQEGITNTHYIAQALGTTEDRLIQMSVNSLLKLKKACAIASHATPEEIKNLTVKPEEVRQSLSEVVKNFAADKAADNVAAGNQLEPAI